MQVIGRNGWGGRVIEVRVPLPVLLLANEISERVRNGEIAMEGEARDLWLTKVQPFVARDLAGFEVSPTADQIVLEPLESVSTLRRSRLVRPSAAAVVSSALRRRSGSTSRPGPSNRTRRRAGR